MFPKLSGEREYSCFNKCKSNCCSDVFLPLTNAMKEEYEATGMMTAKKDYTDWRWLELHDGISILRPDKRYRLIGIMKGLESEIILCPANNIHYLHVKTKCRSLQDDGKCGIYRARPYICRVAKCPAFDKDPEANWIWENSTKK